MDFERGGDLVWTDGKEIARFWTAAPIEDKILEKGEKFHPSGHPSVLPGALGRPSDSSDRPSGPSDRPSGASTRPSGLSGRPQTQLEGPQTPPAGFQTPLSGLQTPLEKHPRFCEADPACFWNFLTIPKGTRLDSFLEFSDYLYPSLMKFCHKM